MKAKKKYNNKKKKYMPISAQYCHFIKFLKNKSEREIRTVVKNLPIQLINVLSEIILNCLGGNITKKPKNIELLKPYRKLMKQIAKRKNSYNNRKSLLASKKGGGLLSLLLPLAATVIGSLVNSKK